MSHINSNITLKDIAKAMGLSSATISLALRDSPKISETRKLQIRAQAKEMCYIPNPAATALSNFKKTSTKLPSLETIAWINYWEDPEALHQLKEYHSYWLGATAAAKKLGYHLEEFQAYGMSAKRLCQILRTRGINGILMPPHIRPPNLTGFDWDHFSIIRLGRSVQDLPCHVVTAGQVPSMIIAVEQTFRKGYKRIGFITGLPYPQAAHFDAGFLRAQRNIHHSHHVPICSIAGTSIKDTAETITQWVDQYKPDAILTNEMNVPEALKFAGYKIPDDFAFAVLSTLDIESNAGIYQNPFKIGEVALHQVIALMTTNVRGIPEAPNETQILGTWVDGADMPDR